MNNNKKKHVTVNFSRLSFNQWLIKTQQKCWFWSLKVHSDSFDFQKAVNSQWLQYKLHSSKFEKQKIQNQSPKGFVDIKFYLCVCVCVLWSFALADPANKYKQFLIKLLFDQLSLAVMSSIKGTVFIHLRDLVTGD